MYGRPAAASLRVYVSHSQAYSRPEWSRRDVPPDRWLEGQVTLRAGQPLQVGGAEEAESGAEGQSRALRGRSQGRCSETGWRVDWMGLD